MVEISAILSLRMRVISPGKLHLLGTLMPVREDFECELE
jgi:hypothetical protein